MTHCIRCGNQISNGEVNELDDMCLDCVELFNKNRFPPRSVLILLCALMLGTLTPYLIAMTVLGYVTLRLIKLLRTF
ncbi:MAG: hypothetical protein ACXABO_14315 [Promethearchaeota archaeon]|jgi:predicted nucleic acid-binding Zn ribbon protein